MASGEGSDEFDDDICSVNATLIMIRGNSDKKTEYAIVSPKITISDIMK